MIQKTNYKYYLANGSCISYDLFPDCDLARVIDGLAANYVTNQMVWIPDQVLVTPYVFRKLEEQLQERYNMIHLQNYSAPVGFAALQFQSTVGPLKVVPVPDLELPIFIGRHEEYKDNCFDALLEDILCDQNLL